MISQFLKVVEVCEVLVAPEVDHYAVFPETAGAAREEDRDGNDFPILAILCRGISLSISSSSGTRVTQLQGMNPDIFQVPLSCGSVVCFVRNFARS